MKQLLIACLLLSSCQRSQPEAIRISTDGLIASSNRLQGTVSNIEAQRDDVLTKYESCSEDFSRSTSGLTEAVAIINKQNAEIQSMVKTINHLSGYTSQLHKWWTTEREAKWKIVEQCKDDPTICRKLFEEASKPMEMAIDGTIP